MHVISFALLLLAAVPALQPYYTPDDKILDPNIVGVWRVEDSVWEIMPAPQRTDYDLIVDGGEGGYYTATLFQIGGNRFLDLKPAPDLIDNEFLALQLVPAHTLFRVWLTGDAIRIAPMDNDRLAVMLTQEPNMVSHVWIEREGTKPLLVLTGATAQLKDVIKKNLDQLFVQPMSLIRDPNAPVPYVPVLPSGAIKNDAATTETISTVRGMALNSAQVAVRAARYANDETEKQFGARPFRPTDWVPKWENNRWHWGQMEYTGVSGYSADVTMNRDGSEVEVKIFRTAPDQPMIPGNPPRTDTGKAPEPPRAPIVPRY